MSVDTIINTISKTSQQIHQSIEKDPNAVITEYITILTEKLKELLNISEDVKFTINAADPDQKAVLEIFLDCIGSLQALVVQIEAHGLNRKKAEALKNLKTTIASIDDAGRGVIETYAALSESQLGRGGGVRNVKNTVPVTIITGFLGSGKTTFLNYILTQNHGKRIAVIENEFGEVGIDDALVKDKFSGEEEIFQMNNGCICCTVRGDLIKALGSLLERADKFDYIMIETTGLADPAPIVQTFFTVPEIGTRLRIDGIVTLVDSKHVQEHLAAKSDTGIVNEVEQQIAFADVLLLNKTDLVKSEEVETLKIVLQEINKFVEIIPTQRSVVPLDKILNIRAFDLNKAMDFDPKLLTRKQHDHEPKPGHASSSHLHATLVTSVGIVCEGECRMNLLNAWMGRLLREKGADIYRMKGVLAVKDMPNAFVFQAVHMVMDATQGAPWPDNKRVNKIVFIGKNLNREEIEKGFKGVLVQN
jgi:G3E family GTPase